jgi:hypothetical protein
MQVKTQKQVMVLQNKAEFLVSWFNTDLKFDEHSLMLFASPDSFL